MTSKCQNSLDIFVRLVGGLTLLVGFGCLAVAIGAQVPRTAIVVPPVGPTIHESVPHPPDFQLSLPPGKEWVLSVETGKPASDCPGGEGGKIYEPTLGRYDCGHSGASRYALDFLDNNRQDGELSDRATVDVLAAATGTVSDGVLSDGLGGVWEHWCAGYGIDIDHGNGYLTRYAHLRDRPGLRPGQLVTAGQKIGVMGAPRHRDCGFGVHLHFEIRYNGEGAKFSDVLDRVAVGDRRMIDYRVGSSAARAIYYLSTNSGPRLVGPDSFFFGSQKLWGVDRNNATSVKLTEWEFPEVTDIASGPDGSLYGVTYDSFLAIDPAIPPKIRTLARFGAGMLINALDLGPDRYLYAAGGAAGDFLRISPTTLSVTHVGRYGRGLISSGDLAFSPSGVLYASVRRSAYDLVDRLVTVDPRTGAVTEIGAIGFSNVFGLAFDSSGRLLGSAAASSTGTPLLIEIDPKTGKGTALGIVRSPGDTFGGALGMNGLTWRASTGTSSPSAPTLRIDGGPSSTRPIGETFSFTGAAFTPNGTVTRYIRPPNGDQATLAPVLGADSGGNLAWSFTPTCTTPTGTYTVWAVDDASGRTSNTVTDTVTRSPACDTASQNLSGQWDVVYEWTFSGCAIPPGYCTTCTTPHSYLVTQSGNVLRGTSLDNQPAQLAGTVGGSSVQLTLTEFFLGGVCTRTFSLSGTIAGRRITGAVSGGDDNCGTCRINGTFTVDDIR